MEVLMTTDFTSILAVGIDPAKGSHYGVAMVYPEQILLSQAFDNTPEAILSFDDHVQALAEQQGLEVIYGLEDTCTYGKLAKELLLQRGRNLREINPIKTNRQKDFYGPDKTDAIDATCLAQVVMRQSNHLPQLQDTDPRLKLLQEATRFRQMLVRTQNQFINRLHVQLTQVYGGVYRRFFGQLDSVGALTFFQCYPVPQNLAGVTVESLAQMLREACDGRHGRGPNFFQRANTILAHTHYLQHTALQPEVFIKAEMIRQMVQTISHIAKTLKNLEVRLEQLTSDMAPYLKTLPAVDTVTAAVLLAETRSSERFKTRHCYARFNGTAPRTKSSGRSTRHRPNFSCNRRLKHIFHQMALTASIHDPVSKAYFQRLIHRGLSRAQARKRLARRLSDVVYSVMKHKSIYQPAAKNKQGETARSGLTALRANHKPLSLISPLSFSIAHKDKALEDCRLNS